jgi:hypothetical protein
MKRFLHCLFLLLPLSALNQPAFKPATYNGYAATEPMSLVVEQATASNLVGKITDSQGSYPFSAMVTGDSILQGEADLQVIRLAFTGRLVGSSGLRINFITPDGSGEVASVMLNSSPEPSVEPAADGLDPAVIGTWSSTVTESTGWGESLSILSYVVLDVFYPDGSYGTGKGDMQTMDANYSGYDKSIQVQKQPGVSWRTGNSTFFLELTTDKGPQKMQGAYTVAGDKLRITWGDGEQVELTRRR